MDKLKNRIQEIVCEAGAVFSVLENEDDVSEAERILYRQIEERSMAVRSARSTSESAKNPEAS
ncbi:hypothetical protein [Eggerthella timonensis]|uniref:hypothetical protein n=1 Tax=Eggerthella timonensis TaxID=1871008 RepID=UPI000C77E35B|nr:hypothetical protein [Eggerthella timonensis]